MTLSRCFLSISTLVVPHPASINVVTSEVAAYFFFINLKPLKK